MTKKRIQKIMGSLLLGAMIYLFIRLFACKELSGINFVIGALFGMVMVRGDFSFSANLRNPILKKDYRFTYLFWQLTILTCLGFLLVMFLENYYGVFHWLRYAAEPTRVSFYFCISAIIFGFGLSFLGSAGSGLIKKSCNANIGFIVAVFSYFPGAVCGVLIREWAISYMGERSLYMPELFGWPLALFIQFILLVIAFKFIKKGIIKYGEYEADDEEENILDIAISDLPTATKTNAVIKELFVSEIQADRGILFIAIIAIVYFAFNQKVIATAMPLALAGYRLLYALGLDTPSLFQNTGLPGLITQPFMENQQLTMILGYALGTILVPLWKGKYRIKKLASIKKSIIMIVGGFCVGFGVQGIYGANIGEVFGAISMLSLSGWIIIPFICLGIFLGRPLFFYLSTDKNHPRPQ